MLIYGMTIDEIVELDAIVELGNFGFCLWLVYGEGVEMNV